MSPTTRIWKMVCPSPGGPGTPWSLSSEAMDLARDAGIPHLQAQLLTNRGITDPSKAQAFLRPRLSHMADPMLMAGMEGAVDLILRAVEGRLKITIYGDYDADGITATALLWHFFTGLDVPVSYYIPDRIREGYGLNRQAVHKIAEQGTALLITVDCGISNRDEVALAKTLGMKVVVTDHHRIPEGLDLPCPVINPHQVGCPFPCKDLTGVGLAFYVAVAVRSGLRRNGRFRMNHEPDLRKYLDLVALGTVADRAQLLDQNRLLVSTGMEVMSGSWWPGIEALKEVAQVGDGPITAEDLAFRLAPRLNAPGRTGEGDLGIRLLTLQDTLKAKEIASRINGLNSRRQDMERQILEEIEERMQSMGPLHDRKTLVVAGEGWHPGVLGIVASRLVDRYHRPSIVLSIHDGLAVGSGRSIDGFDLYGALSKLHHLLNRFGGHTHAAGLALKASDLPSLKEELEGWAGKILDAEALVPRLMVDAELGLHDLTPEVIQQIQALAPFGEGNPLPCFLSRGLEIMDSRVVGTGHLKLVVRHGEKAMEAIGFRLGDRSVRPGRSVDMLFTPEVNTWQGVSRIQLKVSDLKILPEA